MSMRWEQRFSNFNKALKKLSEAIEYSKEKKEDPSVMKNEIIKEGIIQRFEYTHELAWKTMKDYAKFQGIPDVAGSKDASREAYQLGLISEADTWMDMMISRNKTSHTYDESTVQEIYEKIIQDYSLAFQDLQKRMETKLSK